MMRLSFFVLSLLLLSPARGFVVQPPLSSITRPRCELQQTPQSTDNPSNNVIRDKNRRTLWTKTLVQFSSALVGATGLALLARPVWAAGGSKSRTDGYAVQKTDAEWRETLSPIQYDVLRNGGTERPGFSILEIEKRAGIFKCAGCGTPLFDSRDKFQSGTGWPSFARALPGVETEKLSPVLAQLSGAELRCRTCGGHLGDVFQDGFVFPGTEAAKTGQRYCIDGAALVFYPGVSGVEGQEGAPLRGDVPKPQTDLPSWLEPPRIKPRDSS